MKNIQSKLILLLLVVLFSVTANSQNLKTITVLHWNDFHSANVPVVAKKATDYNPKDSAENIGGFAYLAAYVNHYRDENKNIIVLDAGDDFQGAPVSTLTKGFSQIELNNFIMPDAVALGNHDFDYTADTLFKFLKKAKYDIVDANLSNTQTHKTYFNPYKIIVKNNIKVAIIGIMTPDLYTLTMPTNLKNVTVDNYIQTTRNTIKLLKKKEKPNLIIVLTHCGVDRDKILADSVPEINLIIGGHSHTPIKKPEKHNHVLICQAGSKGRYLGKVDLTVDMKGDSIASFTGELVSIVDSKYKPDQAIVNRIDELEKLADKGLNQVIGTLVTTWNAHGEDESNLGDWQCEVMRSVTNSDIAFQNSGGIRKGLPAGNITIRDIWEINPFGNSLMKFSVSGDSLKKMLEYIFVDAGERIQVGGLRIEFDPSKPAGQRIISLTIGGVNCDDKKTYSICTNNYVAAQYKKYFGFSKPFKVIDTGLVDRDIFIEAVKEQKSIDSKIDGRIKRAKQ